MDFASPPIEEAPVSSSCSCQFSPLPSQAPHGPFRSVTNTTPVRVHPVCALPAPLRVAWTKKEIATNSRRVERAAGGSEWGHNQGAQSQTSKTDTHARGTAGPWGGRSRQQLITK